MSGSELLDGTVAIPWRVLVILGCLAMFGVIVMLIMATDRLFPDRTQAPPTPPSRREALDRFLDGVFDRPSGEGVMPDTFLVLDSAKLLARYERDGEPTDVLLRQLDRMEARMGDLGLRLMALPTEDETDQAIAERLERYSSTTAVAS